MVAGGLAVTLVAAGGYAVADALDLAPGILTLAPPASAPGPVVPGPVAPGPSAPATLPTPGPPDPLLTGSGEEAPVPSAAALERAVRTASDDPALATGLGVSIRDGVSGEELLAIDAERPRVPASTVKLLAALAVAGTLDLGSRAPTSVVAEPGSADLVLLARGDMLLAPGAGSPEAVVGRAGLADLADQVAGALRRDGRTSVTLRMDLSFAPGPAVLPTWDPGDVRGGFTGPVAMAGLATRRAAPGRPAPARPEVPVAQALVDRLAERGITAALQPEGTWVQPAPEAAEALGVVESATYGELLDLALDESDNALTESLVRQAAATAGEPTAAADSNAAFVRARLEAAAVPVPGLVLKDASGLSPGQAVAPVTLSAVLARAVDGESGPMRRVVAGLPVSGLTGTLRDRFADDATMDVLGVPRAKTGTLRAGSSLAGTTVTADGRPLIFAVQVDGFPWTDAGTRRARSALDRIVAALTRCGCR